MQNTGEPLATLHGVRKRYGAVVALDGVDLEIRGAEVLAVLGANGAGKSTAIGTLLGLIRADAGRVELFGEDPQCLSARRRIGVMLQQAMLPPTLRVGELIRLSSSYYPLPRAPAETAALAGVDDLLKRPYATLSGGQQRRVQFALALCGRPRLLFLDEPTVGMDLSSRQKLWAAIRHLVAEGNSVVLTTHYLEEAEALADRVCVLARGRVVSQGSVDALRACVSVRRVRCRTTIDAATARAWPGVVETSDDGGYLSLSCNDTEAVVRRLLAVDPTLAALEVRAAGLAEAFEALTRDDDAVEAIQREAA